LTGKQNMKPFPGNVFIYGLKAEGEGLRYIGVTKCSLPKRLREHRFDARTSDTRKARWLRKCFREGREVSIVKIAEVPEATWPEWEQGFIRRAREIGVALTNTCDGGVGLLGLPAESRARIAAFWLGRKHKPETIARISAAKKNPSPETRAKISAAAQRQWQEGRGVGPWWKGKKQPPEMIAKIAATRIGKKLSAETRAKIAEAARRQWAKPGAPIRAAVTLAKKGKSLTAAHRAKLVAGQQRRHARAKNVLLSPA
jgi:hypothetical protein